MYHIADLSDIQPDIRPGDIFAFSGNGAVSDLVKIATKSKVSHIAIALDKDQLIESTSLNGMIGVSESTIR